jgi:SAM-dependent methyltransferase
MRHSGCRWCGADLYVELVDLGTSPLCETFLAGDQLDQAERYYPLRAFICDRCFLVQMPQYVSPEDIFSAEYPYFSSYSESWLRHAKKFADDMITRFRLNPLGQVIEIGSNDGYLLQYFAERRIPVLGIEPAGGVALAASRKGIPTVARFFNRQTASEMVSAGLQADLLVANNVFAHVPQLADFMEGARSMLKPAGVLTMEFPYVVRLLAGNQFDTIYHEHLSYFSFYTVEHMLAAHDMTIFDVDELRSHGGSLRVYARHAKDQSKPISASVPKLRTEEYTAGVATLQYYASFRKRVADAKHRLLEFLIKAKRAGKSIAGYGAPGKGNTLLNYCGIRTDFLDYLVDRNPVKHHKFTPGTHIPIHPVERIETTKPDYLLILPWNLTEEVTQQMAYIRGWGGQFVVPIPTVQVIQ